MDLANPLVGLRPGSLNSITLASLAVGDCHDFYFEVSVTRSAAAYDTTRRFHIDVTSDQTGALSTPNPRELYVEHLISQNCNSTIDVKLDGVSIPSGGTMALVVGNTYTIELVGATATNGYEQIETFINFPNTIFRVNSVVTTYTANGGTDPQALSKLYADGCDWDNDPNSPNYRACAGTGKYGGDVTVTYDVTIISGGGTSQTLNTLIYDFSGSSYHYNADFSTSTRIATIIDSTTLTLVKSFVPDPTNVNGVSVLTFTITNPNAASMSGLSFTDIFPTSPGDGRRQPKRGDDDRVRHADFCAGGRRLGRCPSPMGRWPPTAPAPSGSMSPRPRPGPTPILRPTCSLGRPTPAPSPPIR